MVLLRTSLCLFKIKVADTNKRNTTDGFDEMSMLDSKKFRNMQHPGREFHRGKW